MNEEHNYNQLTGQKLTDAVRQAIEYEQRAAFVDSFCSELNDSVPDPEFAMLMMGGEINSWLSGTVFPEITVENPFPPRLMPRQYSNEASLQGSELLNREVCQAHTSSLSGSTQPRGSPPIFLRRRSNINNH